MDLEIQGQISVVLSRVAPEVTALILENPFTTEPPKSKSTIEKKPLRYISRWSNKSIPVCAKFFHDTKEVKKVPDKYTTDVTFCVEFIFELQKF